MSGRFHPLHRQSGKLSGLSYAIPTVQSVLNGSIPSANQLVPTTGDNGHTRQPALHIARTHEGFEISGEVKYRYIANQTLMDALERTMDEFILPLLRSKPDLTMRNLIAIVGNSADYFFPMGIPWTGIYLLAHWRLQEERTRGFARHLEYGRVIDLLTPWYELEKQAGQVQ